MKVVVFILLFATVAIATRVGIQYWRPLADSDQVLSICITLAAAACLILATNRQKHKSPAEEKYEPRFQGTSPYDGGVIVGTGAIAASVYLPDVGSLQPGLGGGSPGHAFSGHAGDGNGGDGAGVGGH